MEKNIEEQIISSIFNLMRIVRKHITSKLNIYNLTMLQIETLYFLHANPKSTMADIAQQLQISKPTATIHLDRLVQLGLVSREDQSSDRRLVLIVLTSQGKKLLTNKLKERKAITKEFLSCLSKQEKEKMLKTFSRLLINLEKKYEKK